MKNLGIASITTAIAAGAVAAVLGFAAPANADLTHQQWVNDIQHSATSGQVPSTVGNGR